MSLSRRAAIGCLAVVCALASALATGLAPPATEVRPVFDRLHNVEFVDSYRWLEQQDAPEVRRWIEAQNAYADAILGRSGELAALTRVAGRFMDRPDVGRAQRGGDFEYFTLRRAGEEQAAIYRRPAPASNAFRLPFTTVCRSARTAPVSTMCGVRARPARACVFTRGQRRSTRMKCCSATAMARRPSSR